MNFDTIFFIIIFIVPSNIIGEEFSAVLMGLLGIIYLARNKDKIKLFNEAKYFYIAQIAIIIFALLSLVHTSVFLQSLSEAFIYLDALLYFVIALNIKEKGNIIKAVVITAALSSVFFCLYEGFYLNVRISGTVGYANSYALLLLAALFFSEVLEEDNMILMSKLSIMLGIIFTGSRNTFLYLLIYLVISLFKQRKKYLFRHNVSIFIFDIIIYTLFNLLGIGFIFLLPIMIFIFYYCSKIKITNKKVIYTLGIVVLLSMLSFSILTNTGRRLLNASLNSGVLQERFVYYEDSLKQITHNVFGNGISTFQYRQFKNQSAFYDVKYIHNSILQIAYDLGILPMLILLIAYLYGGIKLFKSKANIYYIAMYIIIFLHSLLDFDFSYAPIFVIPGIILAFCLNPKDNLNIKVKNLVIIPLCTLIIITTALNFVFFLGNLSLFMGSSNMAINFYNIYSKASFCDAVPYKTLGDLYLKNGDYEKAEDYLTLAYKINRDDPRIIWNLAYAKEKNNKIEEALAYKNMLLDYEKYNYKMYKFLYSSLKSNNANIDSLKKTYYDNLKSLNSKAKYMKNQLPERFEEAN